ALAAGNEPCLAQHLEMAHHRDPRYCELCGDLAGNQRPLSQQVQDPAAGWVGQRPPQRGGFFLQPPVQQHHVAAHTCNSSITYRPAGKSGNPGALGAPTPMLSADGVAFGARGWFVVPELLMKHGLPLLGGRRIGRLRLAGAVVMLSAAALGSSSCAGAAAPPRRADPPLVARAELAASGTSVLAGAPDALATGVAGTPFSSAPVVVLANAGRPAHR